MRTYGYALLLVAVASSVLSVPLTTEENEVGRGNDGGNWRLLMKILEDCTNSADAASCLGVKAVTAMQRAARLNDIELAEGVAFVKTTEEQGARALPSENDVQQSLEQEQPQQRTARLLDLMMDAVAEFFRTHSLQFKVPEEVPQQLQRALEEGRGKKKMIKMLLPLLIGVGGKLLLLIPAGIALIALVATKALLVSKVALILAGILAVQKFLGGGGLSSFGKLGGGGGWSSGGTGGWSSGAGAGGWSSGAGASSGGWGRSTDAHQMAYAAQAPAQPSQ